MSKARQLADLGNQVDDGAITGSNMVINGGMTVAQRGTSATNTTGGGLKTIDRMRYTRSGFVPSLNHSQSTDAPDGFSYSYKVEVATADTIGTSTEYSVIDYNIEAQDLQHLKYGSASAKAVTLSFWVKSNVTGTYAVGINQHDSSRDISSTYTVNASGAWEYKTVTFLGDVSGTINNDNGIGLNIEWPMSTGSNFTGGSNDVWGTADANRWAGHAVSVFETNSNYWQITGVCLNVGDSAIDFPHESYGDTLAKCQRYYEQSYTSLTGSDGKFSAVASTGSNYLQGPTFRVTKRTQPTMLAHDGISEMDGSTSSLTAGSFNHIGLNGALRLSLGGSGRINAQVYRYHWTADAEL
jgi:hypothetical protein